MRSLHRTCVAVLGFAALMTAGATTPSFARWYDPGEFARHSNTYETYMPGEGGCVQDNGYGRVQEGCDN